MSIEGFRLSPQQRALWLADDGPPEVPVSALVSLGGPVDPDRLRAACAEVMERHEILRTLYRRPPGVKTPFQVVSGAADPAWEVAAEPVADGELTAAAEGWRRRHGELLDPENGPVVAATLSRVTAPAGAPAPAERHALLLSLAPLSADEVTFPLLVGELLAAHGGAPRAGDEEPVQYGQYSEWQHETMDEEGEERDEGLAFWREREVVDALPLDPPSASRTGTGDPEVSVELPPVVRALLGGADPGDLLAAAIVALARRLTGARRVAVARRVDGRRFPELEDGLGPYARWLPLVLEPDGSAPFAELLERTRDEASAAAGWQELHRLAAGDGAALPAVGVGLVPPPLPDPPGDASGLHARIERWWFPHPRPAVEVTIRQGAGGSGPPRLVVRRDRAAVGAACAERLARQLVALLAAAGDGTPIDRLDLSASAGPDPAAAAGAEPARDEPEGEPVHVRIVRQAERTPDATAVLCGERRVTYGELDRESGRLAAELRRRGVGAEAVVAIATARSPELLIGLLAIWKAGGAALPIDPAQPAERVRFMIDEAATRAVVVDASTAGSALGAGLPVVRADRPDASSAPAEAGKTPAPCEPEGLAYVLYTSGSTGRPKGVMVPHRGLANYLTWAASAYGLSAGSRSLVHSPVIFDLTLTGLLAPLLAGGRVELVPEEEGLEGLSRRLAESPGGAFVKLTPSHLRVVGQLVDPQRTAAGVAVMVLGGEALSGDLVAPWRLPAGGPRVINEYGPTETVVGCTWYDAGGDEGPSGTVPIGRPIDRLRVRLFDRWLEPMPEGGVGELCVGGAGVARGYLGRPARTAERFVPDPSAARPGERLYATGDLARLRADGELEYLGRVDDQVKIRGVRVEPGEVRAVLAEHPGVAEAVVVVGRDERDAPRLIAYVVPLGDDPPEPEAIEAFLADRLPPAMMPSAVVPLARLPLTGNGKLDRDALPEPRRQREAAHVAPETAAEREIAEVWQEVLRVEAVGRYENFFDLGGHSLLMVQVFGRIEGRFDTEVTMAELFEYPTVHAMAERLSAGVDLEGEARRVDRRADRRRLGRAAQERRRQAAAALDRLEEDE
jgi:amino acid adenylation domain-containing protein